jgi:hypothetical protein
MVGGAVLGTTKSVSSAHGEMGWLGRCNLMLIVIVALLYCIDGMI